MLILTQKQIEEVMNIVDRHHSLFITTNIGVDYLSQFERRTLIDAGIDIDKWKGKRGKVEEAYAFGMLTAAISDERAKNMNYKEFKKFMQSKNFIPLTSKEQAAIDHLKYQTHSDVKYLNNKIKGDINSILINQDKILNAKLGDITREAAIKTVEMRGSVRDMISEMGTKTGMWESNLGRIAEYTLHNAYEEGRAASLEKEYGKDVLVYKDVYPGACFHCIKHYLTAGIGSRPIVFKLDDLKANGSNVGRKVGQWLPTLDSLHFHCRCTVNEVPEGYIWSDEKGSFIRGRPTITNERVKNRKKVSIKIGEDTYLV